LQLENNRLNDVLLLYVLDFIRRKKYIFKEINFSNNLITDEGMKILLNFLNDYPTTVILNLKSNCLTVESLKNLLYFDKLQSVRRKVFLRNNKIKVYEFD
jgi:hypothetical protein